QNAGQISDALQKDVTGTAKISNKLNTIIIPRIEFRDASIREAIDFIRQQAAANDPAPEGRKGIDIVLRLTPIGASVPAPVAVPVATPPPAAAGGTTTNAANGELVPPPAATPIPAAPIAPAVVSAPAISPSDARITITLNQIPLGEALRY